MASLFGLYNIIKKNKTDKENKRLDILENQL